MKFSAIEIYNENVRDLLSPDPTPLRCLDDPEVSMTVISSRKCVISYRETFTLFG